MKLSLTNTDLRAIIHEELLAEAEEEEWVAMPYTPATKAGGFYTNSKTGENTWIDRDDPRFPSGNGEPPKVPPDPDVPVDSSGKTYSPSRAHTVSATGEKTPMSQSEFERQRDFGTRTGTWEPAERPDPGYTATVAAREAALMAGEKIRSREIPQYADLDPMHPTRLEMDINFAETRKDAARKALQRYDARGVTHFTDIPPEAQVGASAEELRNMDPDRAKLSAELDASEKDLRMKRYKWVENYPDDAALGGTPERAARKRKLGIPSQWRGDVLVDKQGEIIWKEGSRWDERQKKNQADIDAKKAQRAAIAKRAAAGEEFIDDVKVDKQLKRQIRTNEKTNKNIRQFGRAWRANVNPGAPAAAFFGAGLADFVALTASGLAGAEAADLVLGNRDLYASDLSLIPFTSWMIEKGGGYNPRIAKDFGLNVLPHYAGGAGSYWDLLDTELWQDAGMPGARPQYGGSDRGLRHNPALTKPNPEKSWKWNARHGRTGKHEHAPGGEITQAMIEPEREAARQREQSAEQQRLLRPHAAPQQEGTNRMNRLDRIIELALQEAEGAVRRPKTGGDRGSKHRVATAVDRYAEAGMHGAGETGAESHAGRADLQDLAARKKLGYAGKKDPGKHSGAREKFKAATVRDAKAASGDPASFWSSNTVKAGQRQRDDVLNRRQQQERLDRVIEELISEEIEEYVSETNELDRWSELAGLSETSGMAAGAVGGAGRSLTPSDGPGRDDDDDNDLKKSRKKVNEGRFEPGSPIRGEGGWWDQFLGGWTPGTSTDPGELAAQHARKREADRLARLAGLEAAERQRQAARQDLGGAEDVGWTGDLRDPDEERASEILDTLDDPTNPETDPERIAALEQELNRLSSRSESAAGVVAASREDPRAVDQQRRAQTGPADGYPELDWEDYWEEDEGSIDPEVEVDNLVTSQGENETPWSDEDIRKALEAMGPQEPSPEDPDPGGLEEVKDKDWIQKAVNPKHKGYCTPMTKKTCTPERKALAKRFKKAGRKEKKKGGTGWEGKV